MQNTKTLIIQKIAMAMLAAFALSTQSLLAADPAAADLTATPPAGSGFVIKNVPGTQDRFRVQESGEVRVPGLPTAAPGNTVLCFNNITGQLGPCAPGTVGTPPCLDPNNRFKDCGDGTVFDKTTGLMWEKKLASGNAACTSGIQASRNVRCEQNTYTWSAAPPFTATTGTLYTDFLPKLNLDATNDPSKTCFANHCDWRIPTIVELQTILASCTNPSCIDPIFGPTRASFYWSSSSLASDPSGAWNVGFSGGGVFNSVKGNAFYARAVRSGR